MQFFDKYCIMRERRCTGEGEERIRMSTLKDIAKLAGVSVTTVSHVLNKTRFVSNEIEARVSAAVDELQYRPNRLAQSLRKQQTKIIGFIAPLLRAEATNSFCMRVLQGACSVLNEENYSVILGDNSHCTDQNQENEVLLEFRAQMVDGLIILPGASLPDLGYMREAVGEEMPIVIVDHHAEGAYDLVQVDAESGYCDLVNRMIAEGHRRIGLITGSLGDTSAYRRRFDGYRKALSAWGIPLDRGLVGEDTVLENAGYSQMRRLVAENPDMTAVVMLSNVMAVGAMSYLNEKRIQIPKDLAVVVIDDYTWSRMTTPPLTVIDQPTYLLGRKASQLLLERLKNPDTPYVTIREPLTLIRRGSF